MFHREGKKQAIKTVFEVIQVQTYLHQLKDADYQTGSKSNTNHLQGTHFKYEDRRRLKIDDAERYTMLTNQANAEVVVLISDMASQEGELSGINRGIM